MNQYYRTTLKGSIYLFTFRVCFCKVELKAKALNNRHVPKLINVSRNLLGSIVNFVFDYQA